MSAAPDPKRIPPWVIWLLVGKVALLAVLVGGATLWLLAR